MSLPRCLEALVVVALRLPSQTLKDHQPDFLQIETSREFFGRNQDLNPLFSSLDTLVHHRVPTLASNSLYKAPSLRLNIRLRSFPTVKAYYYLGYKALPQKLGYF